MRPETNPCVRMWLWPLSNLVYMDERINYMMTSSNENIILVTGPLCGEFTGDRSIPRTKASDAELWCFLWSAPEYTVD